MHGLLSAVLQQVPVLDYLFFEIIDRTVLVADSPTHVFYHHKDFVLNQ